MVKELSNQEEQDDGVVEIDEKGNIRNSAGELLQSGQKPTILRDPEGEY